VNTKNKPIIEEEERNALQKDTQEKDDQEEGGERESRKEGGPVDDSQRQGAVQTQEEIAREAAANGTFTLTPEMIDGAADILTTMWSQRLDAKYNRPLTGRQREAFREPCKALCIKYAAYSQYIPEVVMCATLYTQDKVAKVAYQRELAKAAAKKATKVAPAKKPGRPRKK